MVALGCRMTTDIEVAKQLVKTLLHVDIVIVRQHGERERLAKATGTDEKEILVRVLDLLYETCLVNEVTIVSSYMLEVHHAVGYAAGVCPYAPIGWGSPGYDEWRRTT